MFLKVIILKGAYFKIWHYLSTQGLEGYKIGEMKTQSNFIADINPIVHICEGTFLQAKNLVLIQNHGII